MAEQTIAHGFNRGSMNVDETRLRTLPFRIQTPSTPERRLLHDEIIISETGDKKSAINLIRFCMFGA
jgi:hypothetical protein